MILCFGTTDKLQVKVWAAGAAADAHVSAAVTDNQTTPAISLYRKNTTIAGGATTDITAVAGAGNTMNVQTVQVVNTSTSVSSRISVYHTDGTTTVQLWTGTLSPLQTLNFGEDAGWFISGGATVPVLDNASVSSQSPFASDTYLTGSNIQFTSDAPVVGTYYKLVCDVTKTAVGTGAPTFTIRIGANGTIADTSRLAIAFAAGTAAADVGVFIIEAMFRTVGSGTAAILQGRSRLVSNLTGSGLSNAVKAVVTTGSGFDSTALPNQFIGCSYNGGGSAVHTIQLVRSELIY